MAEAASRPAGLRAVVTGATGAIGKHLVAELLSSPRWERVTVVGRRRVELSPEYGVNFKEAEATGRLRQHCIDMNTLSSRADLFADATHSFCTLGTTRKDAGSAEAFRLVDLTFVTNAAQASHSAGVPYFSHVTASNSSASSWFLYPKTKGEAEDAIKAIGFNHTTILRPGLLDRGSEARSVEKFASWFVSGTKVAAVARAMRVDAEAFTDLPTKPTSPVFSVIDNATIRRLGGQA